MELYSFQVQRALADAFLISSRREQKRSSGRNEITIFHDSTLYIDFVVSTSRILSVRYNRSVCGEQAENTFLFFSR